MNSKLTTYLAIAASLILAFSACDQTDSAKQAHTNKLNVRLEAKVEKLNPLLKGPGYARYVSSNIFQTLGVFDPVKIELYPVMIKELPKPVVVSDGPYKGMQEYSFELRDEAKWDNGSPITAADVVFSYKCALNPLLMSPFTPYLEFLRGVELDPANPKKFKVYLSELYFLGVDALCQMPIYPKYNYDPKGLLDNISISDMADPKKVELLAKQDKGLQDHSTFFQDAAINSDKKTVLGSGAYRLDFMDPAQGVVLVKKGDWWANGLIQNLPFIAAYPDTLHFKLVVAEDAAVNMLRSGELDVIGGLPPATFKKLEADPGINQAYNFKMQPTAMYNRIMINNTDPILSDKKVRQALAHIVDYQKILDEIQLGMSIRTNSPIYPASEAYNKDLAAIPYDITKAKALLAEAGWSDTDGDGTADKMINGQKTQLELSFMNTTGGTGDMITNTITASAAKAGIKLKATPLDINKITEETRAGNFQLAANAASQHIGEADLTQTYHSKSLAPKGDNRMRFSNPQVDDLIDKIKINPNKAERINLSKQLQAILQDETPEIYLYCVGFRLITSKAFDFTYTPMRPGYVDGLAKLKK
jgi:peptide/nickel transport system substrate-binding protein